MQQSVIPYPHRGRLITIPADYVHLVHMKYLEELATEFDLKPWTFRRELKRHSLELPQRRPFSIEHVLDIYLELGWPPKMRKTP
jgi:hypothetical protein